MKSRMGSPRIRRAVASFPPEMIARSPIVNPRKVLPAVPSIILEGWKLKIKNPRITPARMSDSEPRSG